MKYTAEQINFLVQNHPNLGAKELLYAYEQKFNEPISYDAARKIAKRYGELTLEELLVKEKISNISLKKDVATSQRENAALLKHVASVGNLSDDIANLILAAPIKLVKPVTHKSKKPITRSVVMHISDTHIGVNIDRREMGGANHFDPTVASRRFAFLFNEACNYKLDHRDESELVICVNGDIIAGVIHSLEWGVLPLATQMSVAFRIFARGITLCASQYKRVRVIVQGGNHDRAMHKMNKGRQSDQKWDNYTTILFTGLREMFHAHKNISVEIPATPFATFEVQGWNFFMTHGDTVIHVGNPSKSINIKRIKDDINDIIVSMEKKYDVVMVGHVHKSTYQTLDNGTELLINNTLSGLDPFAMSLGIFSSHPSQQLFEVTPEHAVGDMRFVRLKQADKMAELDEVIEPMNDLF